MPTYIYRNQQQTGPFADDDILQLLADGSVSYDDLGWNAFSTEWTPLSLLFPPQQPLPSSHSPRLAGSYVAPLCQTCRQGAMVKRSRYRLSTPVVVIGYILLTPSVLCMVASCLLFMVSVGQSSESSAITYGSISLILLAIAFVGGLRGWLLIMKKQVLECDHCGAVVAAS